MKAVVVHGGPGAPGSVACIARELSKTCGVIEPMQSKHSISELVEELAAQIRAYTQEPITLIGHSWGAWLVVYFAQAHPDMAQHLVLVGSGPFRAEYVSRLGERRLHNLPEEEGRAFLDAIAQLNSDSCPDRDRYLKTLGSLASKADNVDLLDVSEPGDSFPVDGTQYSDIWNEADRLRANGTLYRVLADLRCPITVIQGEQDPHPAEGVTEPLQEQGAAFTAHVLPRCGHSPFKEKHAIDRFYEILCSLVSNER